MRIVVLTTTSENQIPDHWAQRGIRDRQHETTGGRCVQTVKVAQCASREEPGHQQRSHYTGGPIQSSASRSEAVQKLFVCYAGITFPEGNGPRALAYDISAKWDRVITDSFFQVRLPGSRERKEPRDAAQLAQGLAEPKGGNIE